MGGGQLWTTHGYLFGEATSAMQKSIRRGLIEDALYWSHELADRYGKYVGRRLQVIAHEDVGIATPDVLWYVPHLITSNATGWLTRSIHLLAGAPAKTRLADRCMSRVYEHEYGWRLLPSGTAEELANELVLALNDRNEDRALDYAVALEPNDKALWSVLRGVCNGDLAETYPIAAKVCASAQKTWQGYITNKPRGWESNMFFANVVMLLCRRPDPNDAPLDLSAKPPYRLVPDHREVPDYALDIHTAKGRAMGKGMEDFFTEGMKVVPADRWENDYLDRFVAVCREYMVRKEGGKKAEPAKPTIVGPEQMSFL